MAIKTLALFFCLIISLSGSLKAQNEAIPADWLTVPEKTNYEETSTYNQVMSLITEFVNASAFLQLDTLGFSPEGKAIPLVIAKDPSISLDAKETASIPVLYMQGNIHAGEVEGKEALLMILRDIAQGKHVEWLKNRIVLINPIYNADSNDEMEQGIRPSQEDSPIRVGQRPNSQGFDLNRDGMKAEADETKALLKMLQKWDPDLFVDFHTTNGTWHGYRLTWAPAYHTIGDKRLFNYSWYEMLPKITQAVKANYDLDFGPYGWYNFREGWPPKRIETYNHHPRYLVNQMGLRNRMAILSETFAHDRFYIRIQSAYAFTNEILNYFAEHGSTIQSLNKDAESQATDVRNKRLGLRFKKKAMPESFTLRTYDYQPYKTENGEIAYARSGGIVEYDSVLNFSAFEPELKLQMPRAYYIPASLSKLMPLLDLQGIKHELLKKSTRKKVEILMVNDLKQAERAFQGHRILEIEEYHFETAQNYLLDDGGYLISMDQPLSKLAFYLLEGLSDDGLLTWNFLDDELLTNTSNKPTMYPILRIME